VLRSLWLSKGILFLQDNAAPRKAAITYQKLADLHFEVLKHPAYSPDFAPSDYYLFPNLFIKPKTYQPPSYLHAFLIWALDGCEWSDSRHCLFTPMETDPCTPWIGDLVGPRNSLDAVVKRKMSCSCEEWNSGSSVV
jgi:hypothetical protein